MTAEEDLTLDELIRRDMAEISWEELKSRCPLESVVFVDASLELFDVAKAIAEDESSRVADWMDRELLKKLSREQVAKWNQEQPRISGAFISPFVLIKEMSS